MIVTILLFAAGLVLLYVGGEGLVRSAATLGVRFGLSPLVAGLTIVAFATSAPELAVAIDAALNEEPGLALGNVVGSNICNIALILGITALLMPPRLKEQLIRRDALFMLAATLLVPGLLTDGGLSRVEGALLALCLVAYVALTIWQARRDPAVAAKAADTVETAPTRSIPVNALVTVASVGLLVYGSELFVRSAVEIAITIGVPSAVVGLSAAALGTSLPELTAAIVAARHREPEMAAGNLVGSNIFNLLLILGATAMVRPLRVDGVTAADFGVMIAVSVLAVVLMVTRTRVGRAEGVVLTAIYCGYIGWLYMEGRTV